MVWQPEFFKLAGVWLACRQDLMLRDGSPFWRFLGEIDYQTEMHLLLDEVRAGRYNQPSWNGVFIKATGAG